MAEQAVYMIQRIADGKCSTGGYIPRFTTNGKAWSSIGNLKNHLRLFSDAAPERFPYKGCKVIKFDVRKDADPNFKFDIEAYVKSPVKYQ